MSEASVAADEQIAEAMAAEHESLSLACRADAPGLNACSRGSLLGGGAP
jgi:hypothetical protein